jgi:NADH:ubiquinone oxidoreductase subunit 6 (subunit J)
MSVASIAFYGFCFLAALSAAGILFTKNVFYGALLLIVTLLSLAAIYILASAEFVAVTQILIYAGGVLVLIIFGVMLTSKISGKSLMIQDQYMFRGLFIGLTFFSILCVLISQTKFFINPSNAENTKYNSINQIGILLMSDYVLPFEIAGILLLIALIGAAVIASSFNTIKKP